MKKFILNLWNKLSDDAKKRIISLGKTFASTFILVVATSLVTVGHIDWSVSFWGGLLSTGLREAFSAVINTFVPVRLGGRK